VSKKGERLTISLLSPAAWAPSGLKPLRWVLLWSFTVWFLKMARHSAIAVA